MEIEVYYFPPEVDIPLELIEEIVVWDHEHLLQEYRYAYDHTHDKAKFEEDPIDTPEEFNKMRKARRQHWCVAMQREGDVMKLAGFMFLTIGMRFNTYPLTQTKVDNCCVIQSLIVLPSLRGQGIGTILLTYANQFAKQMKLKNLCLGVTELNRNASRLYDKFGFRVLETTYFGIPKKESVPQNFIPLIFQKDITPAYREKLIKSYREYVSTNSKYFYPLYGYTQEIVDKTFEAIDKNKYPIFQFPNDHGWCVFDKAKDANCCEFYPLCITPKGIQHPGQIRKYLYYLSSQIGVKMFNTPLIYLGVINPTLKKIVDTTLVPYATTRYKSAY